MTIPVRAILAASLKSRAAFETAASADFAGSVTDYLAKVWQGITDWYARDADVSSVDPTVLKANLARDHVNPKHSKVILELVDSLVAEDASPANVREYLNRERIDRAGSALAAALASRRPREETDPLLDAYNASLGSVDKRDADGEGDISWADAIRSRTDRTGRLQVTPRVLNDRLGGGIYAGTNITVFGRPESGKSALVLTLSCGFARRGLRVLYCGNEDPLPSLMVRAVSNLTGRTLQQIEADPDGAELDAIKRGADNLIFKQLAPGTLPELRRACETIKPDVLVVDQLRNLSAKGTENFTQNLDAVARGVRAIGIQQECATITVTQAGDSASGKAILDMGDIDSSNTGIPGAADVLIGIGVTPTLEAAGMRMLSVPKNKLNGWHGNLEVRFNAALSKVES